jgi:hypothetical protein
MLSPAFLFGNFVIRVCKNMTVTISITLLVDVAKWIKLGLEGLIDR